MNYPETLQYLYTAMPMYQRIGAAAYKADLENAWKLDEYFGRVHRQFRSIHVGGTNGKGSVSHMLASILQQAGYRVGLYTSPHLLDFRERIKINGKEIPEDYIVRFVEEHKAKFETIEPSFFEMTVFMAFEWFAEMKVDFALIEVGLGGRLDTTNVITPAISVITNIGKDHTQFLGNSLQEIAREKAGIMKENIPLVVGRTQDNIREIFEEKAKHLHCPIHFADQKYHFEYALQNIDTSLTWHYSSREEGDARLRVDLGGDYQKENLATSLTVIHLLQQQAVSIPPEAVSEGLKNVRNLTGLLGRWQLIDHNPLVICDIAHNLDGIEAVVKQLKSMAWEKLHMILGFVNDKDVQEIIRILPTEAAYYLCEPGIPRAMKVADLEAAFLSADYGYQSFHQVADAYREARLQASKNDLIYIGGSTFLVADFMQWKKNNKSF